MISAVTPIIIPIDVCLDLETAKLVLFIFAPLGVFVFGNKAYENLGRL